MSGRGCTIIVKVLGGDNEAEDLSLPVALHSPLEVLKDQLTEIVGIPQQDQVLILCNLDDPDRNSDRLLTGRDFMTLHTCGIKNGSVLTLHALGISAEQKQKLMREALTRKAIIKEDQLKPILTLNTPITAAQANHSYNGVIFDVMTNGPYAVDLTSISIAGMLGRVRIYARDRQWHDEESVGAPTPHWWAHRESVSREGWILVADKFCRPSWDKPIEIKFDSPVILLPHTRRALYCHSGLPDDLGIQYQSYSRDQVVAENEHITVFPGLGHTGSEPFDEQHGWYRSYRALAGMISYMVDRKGWTPQEHKLFPKPLQQAVVTMLMCQNEKRFILDINNKYNNKHHQQQHSNSNIDTMIVVNSDNNIDNQINTNIISGASSSSQQQFESFTSLNNNNTINNNNHNSNNHNNADNTIVNNHHYITISSLPVYVVYNIMEFMHWDWFEEIELNQKKSRLLTNSSNNNRLTSTNSIDGSSSNNLNTNSITDSFQSILQQVGLGPGMNLEILTHYLNQHYMQEDPNSNNEDDEDDDQDYTEDDDDDDYDEEDYDEDEYDEDDEDYIEQDDVLMTNQQDVQQSQEIHEIDDEDEDNSSSDDDVMEDI